MTSMITLCAAAVALSSAGAQEAPSANWLAQKVFTSLYRFDVQAANENDAFLVHAVRVTERRTGKPVQHIAVGGEQVFGEADGLLRLVDANADGHLDIALPMSEGGSSVVHMNSYYLFVPAARQFVYHAQLSALVNPVFAKDGTIETSYGRTGFAGGETWRFRGGRLQRIAYGEVRTSVDGRWETAKECRLAGAKMRCQKTRRRLSAPAG